MTRPSQCRKCVHLLQVDRCLAYPKRIPFNISTGEIPHNQIFHGQTGEHTYIPKEKYKANDLYIAEGVKRNYWAETSFKNLKLEVCQLLYDDLLAQGVFTKHWEYAKLDFELVGSQSMKFNKLSVIFSDTERINPEKINNHVLIEKIKRLLSVIGFNLKSNRLIITIKPDKTNTIEFIPKVFQIPYLRLQCHRCKHRNRGTKCLAYPKRIPDEIFVGNLPHDKIFQEQKGNYIFEPKKEYATKEAEGIKNYPTDFLENLKSKIAQLFYDDLKSQGVLKNNWDFVKLDFELLDNQDGKIREMYVMSRNRKLSVEKLTNSNVKKNIAKLLKIQGPYFNASRLILTISLVSSAIIEFVPFESMSQS